LDRSYPAAARLNVMRTRISLVFILLGVLGELVASEGGSGLGPLGMEFYSQEITVRFRSEADAAKATVSIALLYHDLRAAFSTRMDDSTLNDLVVPKVMDRFGQKGTFYLNSLNAWYQDSPETGITRPKDPGRDIPPLLLAGGNSIGGHTLSHEYLPSLTKNAAFHEILGNRIALESQTGTPVCSFAYPFIAYREANLRDGRDRADLEEMLRRAGYYQLAEHRYNASWDSGLQDALFVSLDNSDGGGEFTEAELTRERCQADRPLFLVTMHAWVSNWGAPDFPKLAAIYARWSGRRDWWYCNQNDYAAYRYQALHARLSAASEGTTVRIVLVRPDPLDLGSSAPLTLKVDGVPRESVTSIDCASADPAAVDVGGGYAFDVPHDRTRGAVAAYAQSDNPSNAAGFEGSTAGPDGLRAFLQRSGAALRLALRNEGTQELKDVRVVFRLPLRWREGVVRRHIALLGAGTTVDLEVGLDPSDAGDACRIGPEYDAAQIDYVGSGRDRLYAATTDAPVDAPASFAQNGFWVLGPLAGDERDFDPLAFAAPFLEGGAPQRSYEVHWSGQLSWVAHDPGKAAILDPDIITTTGKPSIPKFYVGDASIYFPHTNAQYLLYGRVVSPKAMTVRAVFRRDCVRKLTVNGSEGAADRLSLREGINDVRILYAPAQRPGATFTPTNYGCYFRFVDETGRRVEGVRFERPPLP
jgi:peptidoglycan/xylan/chitin deacetylase (PgdA/CDA1 family)